MRADKLEHDSKILHQFIQFYCDKEHQKEPKKEQVLEVFYETKSLCSLPYCLCDKCETLLHYAHERLCECSLEPKPSCRKCLNPCYEKSISKQMAKIMRYSGIRLGFVKLKKLFS